MMTLRICVLISGSGSNLQALIEARDSGRLDVEIVQVISNVASAKGLERATQAGIPCSIVEQSAFAGREDFDHALALLMATGSPDLFVFAGFMRIVGEAVLSAYAGRMINLHPSLLPLYPGLNTYQRALDAGDNEYGASIHFLTEQLDGGPVISQLRIPVEAADDVSSLQKRLAPLEHRLMVATVELFQNHKVECRDGYVSIDNEAIDGPLLLEVHDKLKIA